MSTYSKPRTGKKPVVSKIAYKRRYYKPQPNYRRPKTQSFYPLVGGALGGVAAGVPGSVIGSQIGKGVGNFISGFGDYRVSDNVFLSGAPPIVKNNIRNGSGGIIISFREFIANIVSSPEPNTFEVTEFPIVPTAFGSFPWLSQMASNFQEWEPQGIVYEYRSTSADALNSTNTALGTVMLATNYNAALPPYSSESEMLNSEYSASVKPSANCMHMIECKRSASVLGNLYTKTTGDEDVRFSRLGNFQVATDGFQGASVQCGQLWVTYQISLNKPKLSDALGNDVSIAWIKGNTVSNTNPLGTSWDLFSTSTLDILSPTSTRIIFPNVSVDKQYFVQLFWQGSAPGSLARPTIVFTGGASVVFDMFTDSTGTRDLATGSEGVSGGNALLNQIVHVTGTSSAALMSFATDGFLPTAGDIDIKIMEVPNEFVASSTTIPFLVSQ